MLFGKEEISILVVSLSDKTTDILGDLLSGRVYTDIKHAASVSEAKRLALMQTFDIVVINAPLKDETGIEFATDLSSDSSTGALIFVNNEYYEQVLDKVTPYGVLVVPKPVSKQILYETMNLILATHFRLQKMEHKNALLVVAYYSNDCE